MYFTRVLILSVMKIVKLKGKVFALIISSLIFTIFHTQYYQQFHALFVVFIMGILLGYLYIITGSLYLSIGLHFVVDFYSFITGESNNFLLFDVKISNLVFSLYFDYVTIIVIIILILILAVYRFKHKKLSTNT